MKKITIIGSGYVGTAVACLLSSRNPVTVIDKNKKIHKSQTNTNSSTNNPGFSGISL